MLRLCTICCLAMMVEMVLARLWDPTLICFSFIFLCKQLTLILNDNRNLNGTLLCKRRLGHNILLKFNPSGFTQNRWTQIIINFMIHSFRSLHYRNTPFSHIAPCNGIARNLCWIKSWFFYQILRFLELQWLELFSIFYISHCLDEIFFLHLLFGNCCFCLLVN